MLLMEYLVLQPVNRLVKPLKKIANGSGTVCRAAVQRRDRGSEDVRIGEEEALLLRGRESLPPVSEQSKER